MRSEAATGKISFSVKLWLMWQLTTQKNQNHFLCKMVNVEERFFPPKEILSIDIQRYEWESIHRYMVDIERNEGKKNEDPERKRDKEIEYCMVCYPQRNSCYCMI